MTDFLDQPDAPARHDEHIRAPAKIFEEKSEKEDQHARPLTFGADIEEANDPLVARRIIKIGAAAFVGFLLWASFAPVHELVTGQGSVLPSGLVQDVQHLEGGIVSAVLVHDGEEVAAGSTILRMDDTRARAELASATEKLKSIRLEIERNEAFADNRTATILEDFSLRGVVDSQRKALQVDENFRDAQLQTIQAEVTMRQSELVALEETLSINQKELPILARQLGEYEDAAKKGIVSEAERDRVARDKFHVEAALAQARGQKAAAEGALVQAKARETEAMAGLRQTATTEVAKLEIDSNEISQLIVNLKDRLDRTNVIAPVTGHVHNLVAKNPGQVLQPGQLVAQIVPEDKSVFVEVEVPADRVGLVHEGIPATVKILTFDFARFGGIDATVASISPTSFVRENGDKFFKVRLILDRNYVGAEAAGLAITPGLSVAADIRLGQKTIMEYLLKPVRLITDRAMTQS